MGMELNEQTSEKNTYIKKLTRKKLGIAGGSVVILLAIIVGFSIYNTPDNRLSRQLDLGNRYLDEQNYEQAIIEFNKAIAIDPMRVEAYLGKAQAYEGIGDYENAIEVFYEVLAINSDNIEIIDALQKAYLDYAYMYFDTGDYEQVVVICNDAISNLPNPEESRNTYVQTYLEYAQDDNLDYEKVITAYIVVLELDELNIEAYLGLAETYYLHGEEEKAVEILLEGWEKTKNEAIYDRLSELGYGNIEWTIQRMDNSITDNSGNTLIEIYYDLIYADSRRDSVQKINAFLEDLYDDFMLNEGNKQDLQAYASSASNASAEYPYLSTVGTEITYEDEQYISIKWTQSWHMGGVYNINYSGMVFSLETGEPVELQDLYGFEPNITLAYLKFVVMEYMNNNTGAMAPNAQEACEIVSAYNIEDFSFYLDDGYPVLCFETYELAAGAYGSFEIPCHVPINKDNQSVNREHLTGKWVGGDDINQFIYILTFQEDLQIEYVTGWGELFYRDAQGEPAEIFEGTYDIQSWDNNSGQGDLLLNMMGVYGTSNPYEGLFRITFLGEDVIAFNRIDGGFMSEIRNNEGVLILGRAS